MGRTRNGAAHQKAKKSEVGKALEKRIGKTPAERFANGAGAAKASGREQAEANSPHVLERNDLSELFALADLQGRSFASNASIEDETLIVDADCADSTSNAHTCSSDFAMESDASRERRLQAQARNLNAVRVPRRPTWSSAISAEELRKHENDAFLEWRRSLATAEEDDDVSLTPFEKNLNVWRQLWRVLERSHAVAQIVDARDPLLYRCHDLEAYVLEIHPQKRNLLLLNKADLVPQWLLKRWSDYLRSAGIAFVFFSAEANDELAKNDTFAPFDSESESAGGPEYDADFVDETHPHHEGAHVPEADVTDKGEHERNITGGNEAPLMTSAIGLLDFLEEHAAKSKEAMEDEGDCDGQYLIPRADRPVVGLVGYPNVGKTSTLNALLGRKRAATSGTPGKTKHFQTINARESLRIADSPGLVFPQFASSKAELVAAAVLPIDKLTDILSPVSLIASRVSRAELERGYNMRLPKPLPHENRNRQPTAAELMDGLAQARGYIRDRGVPDQSRAGKALLRDYASGKIAFCFQPPHPNDREKRMRGVGIVHTGKRRSRAAPDKEQEEAIQTSTQQETSQQVSKSTQSKASAHEAAEMLAGVRLGKGVTQPPTERPKAEKAYKQGKEHKKAQKKPPRIKGRKLEKERKKQALDFQSPNGAFAC